MEDFKERKEVVTEFKNPPMPYPPAQPHGYYRLQVKPYVALVIIGIIILLAGGIVYICTGYLKPESTDEYRDQARTITTTGNLIQYIGLIIFSVGVIIGCFTDYDLPPNAKLGLLIAMGIIIAYKLGTSYLAISYLY